MVSVGRQIGRGDGIEVGGEVDPDRSIVARMAGGDAEALGELYGRYRRPLFSYLLLLTPDRGLAEEILQDTLVAVWRGAGRFEGRASVRGWLFGVARRQAHNAVRRRVLPRAEEGALATVAADEPGPEAVALAAAERAELTAAIGALAPLQREVLVLAVGHGLSYAELADVLGVPMGTVKSRLSNARRALQERLASRDGGR